MIGRGSAQDLFDEQLHLRDLLRSQSGTQWVILSTGMFTSFLFEPAFGVFDLEQRMVHGLGSWDNAVTLTTASDIGRLTASVLTTEPAIVDRVVFLAGDTVTYAQAADLVEQVAGVPLKRELWTIPQLRAQLEEDPEDTMAKYRLVFAEGRGVSWIKDFIFNQQQRIPVTDLNQWLRDEAGRFTNDRKQP